MSNKCKPFFRYIKQSSTLEWGEEQSKALRELKKYLSIAPILSAPAEEEDLYLYLAVSDVAVSGVLIREDGGKQKPVFYTSKMLLDAETCYSKMEKMVLALVTAKKKLRHYFESHTIVVMTNCPIGQILSKPDLSGRLTKWAIELGVYDIRYVSRNAKKGQVLVDFLVEIQSFGPLEKEVMILPEEGMTWIMNTDGASNKHGAGIGIVLENSSGILIEESMQLNGAMTNNEAEYEALLYGLELALRLGVHRITINLDSELVSGQLNGSFEAKDSRMRSYRDTIKSLLTEFKFVEIKAIKRELNSQADALAKHAASGKSRETKLVMMEDETEGKGPERRYKVNMTETSEGSSEEGDWMKEIIDFLQKLILPEDKAKARKTRLKAARYALIRGVLYRKSFSGPLLRCLTKEETVEVLNAIHSGVCGNHSGGRSLAHKAITAGYFWPYMMKDAIKFVKKCEKCQKHAPLIHQHSEPYHSVVSPWPFARWGLDIIGKLPLAKAGKCFVLLATDYFTN
ncbi:hypothetical protein UlMin_011053 [Ulmus minor]